MTPGAALWLTLLAVALIQVAMMRLTIRMVGSGAENAWDNALAYVLVTGATIYWPVRWMIEADSFLLTILTPVLIVVVQVISVRVLYEVGALRAWLIGVVHTVLTTAVAGTTAVTGGVIAAYILYGKIVADPVQALRILLRLIGVELPF